MCLGELKSVLTDTHITYIEFDLQKTMLYAEIEIEKLRLENETLLKKLKEAEESQGSGELMRAHHTETRSQ